LRRIQDNDDARLSPDSTVIAMPPKTASMMATTKIIDGKVFFTQQKAEPSVGSAHWC
jgi:hypothetical protein